MPSEPVPSLLLRPPGRPPYAVTLDQLTALVRAARVLRMGRLADKLTRAANAIADLEVATEHDVDGIIKRTEELHTKRKDVMLRKTMQLDNHMTDLVEFGKDLDVFDGKNEASGAGGSSSGNAYTGTTPEPPKT